MSAVPMQYRVWSVALLLFLPLAVHAATCTVSASGVSFGVYDPTSPMSADTSGGVTVSCGPTTLTETLVGFSVSYVVGLGPGSAGSFQPRTMQSGGSILNYNLYIDSARSTIWGDGSGGTQTVGGTLSALLPLGQTVSRDHNVYGRTPAQQNIPAGSYADTITVTVSF